MGEGVQFVEGSTERGGDQLEKAGDELPANQQVLSLRQQGTTKLEAFGLL